VSGSRSLVIRGATVLDPDRPLAVADIAIVDGVITEVGSAVERPGGATTIDGTGLVAMPGLINAHTHGGQHLDRGVAPSLPLDLWLMWVVYGGIDITPDDSYTLAMSGALDMLRTGCTAVLDHAWVPADALDDHVEAMVSAYHDAGIRCALAPMIEDRDIFESMDFGDLDAPDPLRPPTDPQVLLHAMERFLGRYGDRPRMVPMVGPSAPQRCSDELMAGLADLAHAHDAPFHTHVLETRGQVGATRKRYGRSVVEYLDDLGALNERTSLAHCVWLDPDEYGLVRDRKATIVHNPVSNLRIGSGLLPLSGLLDGGTTVALGADGAASNDNQNMFEAMKVAALMHTLSGPFDEWPTAVSIWRAGLRGGAAALQSPIGRIAPGCHGDLVLIDTARHPAIDRDIFAASLVYAEHGESVHTVIVDGEVVVEERKAVTTPADHRQRERALLERIHASIPQRVALLDTFGPVLRAIHHRDDATPLPLERRAVISPAFGPKPSPLGGVGAKAEVGVGGC
jgi:cytosine/adenosine deaminase-related metal-dependent hydrolase